jgi:hypothetical protein
MRIVEIYYAEGEGPSYLRGYPIEARIQNGACCIELPTKTVYNAVVREWEYCPYCGEQIHRLRYGRKGCLELIRNL